LGKCVYLMDNNMPDLLTASLTYEGPIQVNFTLTGFSKEMNRTTKIFGTKGELRGDFLKNTIEILPFRDKEKILEVPKEKGGHGGGDYGLMKHVEGFLQGAQDPDASTLEASIESHITALAAEESRQNHSTVSVDNYRKDLPNL